MPALAVFRFAQKERKQRVQSHVGLREAPLGSSVVPKAFLWGHFWISERGLECVFLGPLCNSSAMTGLAVFRFAQKETRNRVQLHVELRECSLGEFCCSQSLPLRAHLYGRKGLCMLFLGPSFECLSDSGEGYVLGSSERANTEGPVACGAA